MDANEGLRRYSPRERDLRLQNLKSLNFSQENLSGVDLARANLGGSASSDANLGNANPNWAVLKGATLKDANGARMPEVERTPA